MQFIPQRFSPASSMNARINYINMIITLYKYYYIYLQRFYNDVNTSDKL